jgi:glycosyltransferase involved in cell wall biosynthesis
MALGSPVVATAAGGTAELARDGREGLIVAHSDTAALVTALRTAITDRTATAARATAARQRIETDLSFETRMSRLEAVYDELEARFSERIPSARPVPTCAPSSSPQ